MTFRGDRTESHIENEPTQRPDTSSGMIGSRENVKPRSVYRVQSERKYDFNGKTRQADKCEEGRGNICNGGSKSRRELQRSLRETSSDRTVAYESCARRENDGGGCESNVADVKMNQIEDRLF